MTGPFVGAGVVCEARFAQPDDSCERRNVGGAPDTAGHDERSAQASAPLSVLHRPVTWSLPAGTSHAPVTGALVASLLLHALLLLALSGLIGGAPVRVPQPPALDVRIVAASPPPFEPPVIVPTPVAEPPPPPEPQVAPPPVAIAAAPPVAPKPITPPVLARVTVNVEADGPVEEIFANALPAEGTPLPRVTLEFAEPLNILAPERTLRDVPQRRVRGLVRVHASAQLELLVVDEYDDDLMFAIRNALDRTRAKAATEGAPVTPGWAIVVFWFERAAR